MGGNAGHSMTASQYRAMMQGKINRAQGGLFEGVIDSACEEYYAAGIANIEKTPEPMKPIRAISRQRSIFEAVYTKQAQPDYKGTMIGGKSVCFEAKHTENDRILQSAVLPQQKESLEKHAGLGAICFVLVNMGLKYYRVPWEVWQTMKDRFGHKYMNQEDIAPYEIKMKNGVLLFLNDLEAERDG